MPAAFVYSIFMTEFAHSLSDIDGETGTAHPVVHAHVLTVREIEAPLRRLGLHQSSGSGNAPALAEYDNCRKLVNGDD
jgi:hypothetical protein